MKTNLIRVSMLIIGLFVTGTKTTFAAPSYDEKAAFERLVHAVETMNYDLFIVDSDDAFRSQVTKEKFQAVSKPISERLKSTVYEEVYLGDYQQGGYHVTLWKLVFKDSSDDALVTLKVKGNKYALFTIKI